MITMQLKLLIILNEIGMSFTAGLHYYKAIYYECLSYMPTIIIASTQPEQLRKYTHVLLKN